MEPSPLAKKLLLRPGMSALLMRAPGNYVAALLAGVEGLTVSEVPAPDGRFDFAQVFAVTKQEVGDLAGVALKALRRDGLLWVSFPKGSSGIQTDLTRDRGWDALNDAGWRIVSLVSIDETWSAGRFRPGADPRRPQ